MPIYSVSQVTKYVRDLLDADSLLREVYVTGEVSNVTRSAAGHCYFTLKDAESQLRCVMFRTGAVGMDVIQHGTLVTAMGRVGIYLPRGDLQFIASVVQPEGIGELHMEFLRLKAKLEEEGLFDPSRKRPLPAFPKRIAVVTSGTGAVWHDIQNVVRRRYPLVELALAHTLVQGDQAPEGIVAALRAANAARGIDVIIVARGGGSMEELWAFNDERVARAIHASRVPVVSAVGHETDFTIADFVADVRAPTPSAAAELVVPRRADLAQRVADLAAGAGSVMVNIVRDLRGDLRQSVTQIAALGPDIDGRRQRLDDLTRSAAAVLQREFSLWREQVRSHGRQLAALQPSATLARGYAVVERTADGLAVTRVAQVAPGDALAIHLSDGRLPAVAGAGSAPSPVAPVAAAPPKRRAPKRPAPQMPLFG
ncbi:MAG: exodeoxyribonuclease VII large subunit [Dehalococcoidia bacterium]|nr:exodeoxyribonuclease VII large subunit [Dehalococcoidia bacterium]